MCAELIREAGFGGRRRTHRRITIAIGCFVFVASCRLSAEEAGAKSHFENEVQPLLTKHCLRCHGEKKQEGGLRLDSRAALLSGGDGGPSFDPENPGASRILTALLYTDGDLQMPPKGKLPADTIAVFRRWILDGAQFSAQETGVGDKKTFTAADRS